LKHQQFDQNRKEKNAADPLVMAKGHKASVSTSIANEPLLVEQETGNQTNETVIDGTESDLMTHEPKQGDKQALEHANH
jgi:hypothetical protein